MERPSPEEFKELVRVRTDIVQLIGETVQLHPEQAGLLYQGLCPFHDNYGQAMIRPAFTVNPQRRSYKCSICQEGGDCFSFMMKRDNISFQEALEFLARRASLQ